MGRSLSRAWLPVSVIAALMLSALLRAAPPAPLAEAAMRADKAAVGALIKQGADVNAAQGDGMTALHWAAMKGDAEMATLLLRSGASTTAVTRIGAYTPLHLAGKAGNIAAMEAVLELGADVNVATAAGTTPLMLASAAGNVEAVSLLLSYGADVNAREAAKEHTALMFAAAANRAAVVRALVAGGADTRATTTVFDMMEVAIPANRSAQDNAVTKAARLRADADAAQDPNYKPPVRGIDRQFDLNELVAAQGGLTPLLFAARQGHVDTVKALVETGADINQVSTGVQVSPLVVATINGHFNLAMYLVEKGANPNLAAENGVTPLYGALNCQWSPRTDYPQPQAYTQQKTSYLELMQALLDKGANPNLRLTKKVWYSGFTRDLSGTDERGSTAFWRAAYAHDIDAMRLLRAHGADPTIPSSARRPVGQANEMPLHAAATYHVLERSHPAGWRPAFDYLVDELGADVNARDASGNTPLHFAAARGDNDMIRYLVSKGADVMVVNRRGQTTVDMANGPAQRVQPYPETIKLLEGLGAKNNHKCVSC